MHLGPGTSSTLPLNHLTSNGGEPFMILVKITFAPDKTSSGSGFFTKDGGSKHTNKTDREEVNLNFFEDHSNQKYATKKK